MASSPNAALLVSLVLSGAFLQCASAAPAAVALRLSALGGYAVDVGGDPWFASGDLALAVGGAVYSLAAGGLVLEANVTGAGADAIGAFTNTTVSWRTVGGASPGLPLATSFIVYANGAALQFAATLPQLRAGPVAALSATAAPPPLGGLALSFPSLQLTPWALATLQLGSVYQAPNSGNCGWTVNAAAGFPVASGALLVLEPLNASAPRASVGVAALTGQTVVRQAAVGAALALGPGAEFVLPAGYVSRALLVGVAAASAAPPTLPPAGSAADLGFPVGGPGAALRLLGDALLAYRSKPRPAINADSLHAGLGVSTTTFYFYNPCDCGRWANNTCPPDDGSNPGRLPNCMTYADTLERVVASWRSAKIPFTHLLLDSFWYGEGVFNGGVSEWEDDPALMQQVHSFPASLAAFSDAIGRDIDIWAHNGHFVASSPYIAKYPFKGLMPQGPEMWRHLFAANAKAFNLRSIKQDHVGETIASVSPISDPGLISSWWQGMGQAASENNVAVEYCCSPPLVLFESLNVPAANAARSSPDYVLVGEHDASPRTEFQWANGAEAAFHYAIGLMPDKDGFFSNSTEMQQAWKHVPPAQSTPFYNYTEAGALRHATSALLCGGPVHIGDAVDATNVTLVRALMRADGLLLRASRPHAALDVQWRSMAAGAFGAPLSPPARASGAPPPPNSAKPDESFPNNGLGELYSTVSIVPSGPGAAACLRYTVVTSTALARPLSLRAEDLALDSAALATANCTANGAEGFAAYAWDLSAFGPAAAAAGGAPSRIFTGGGGAADELALAWTPAPRYADAPQMLLVAPVLQGWVVLGEVGKLLPLSPFRVTALFSAGAGAVALGLVGAISEAVTVAACRLDAGGGAAACGGGGAAAALFTCTLSSDTPIGFATLTLGADGSGVCS